MSPETLDRTLDGLMQRKPFRPFSVELLNGRRFEVDRPHSVAYRNGVAACMAKGKIFVNFDHADIKQIDDSPAEVHSNSEN